jgi:iron complex outermembrane receptor protein
MHAGIAAILTTIISGQDSVPCTDTAHILARRLDFATLGRSVIHIPLQGQVAGLNNLLAQNGVFVRQYGPAGTGSVSRRGADPSQIQVLWNGMVLNSPMLGQADLSLVQLFGHADVSFTEGSNSSFYGSGSVGGTLTVSHKNPQFDGAAWKSVFSYGSFNQHTAAVEFAQKNKRGFVCAALSRSAAENEYRYAGEQGNGTMMNAGFGYTGGRLSAGFNNKKWDITTHAEMQCNERGLGTVPGSSVNNGWQKDRNARATTEAVYKGAALRWVNRVGAIADEFIYHNDFTHTRDSSRSLNTQLQSELYLNTGLVHWVTGLDYSHTAGRVKAYGGRQILQFPAQFVSAALLKGAWSLLGNFRWEWREKIPSGSVSLEYKKWKDVILRWNGGTTFRRPTLNDFFWAGNRLTELTYERGAGSEAGLMWKVKRGQLQFKNEITAWWRFLRNPIVWLPENGIWTPRNLNLGRYTGLQFYSEIVGHWTGSHAWEIKFNGEWTRAIIFQNARNYRQIFVPALTAALNTGITIKTFYARAILNYTGKRFTATDNLSSLPAYVLTGLQAGRKIELPKMEILAEIQADNIAGVAYENMPGRPMPLRSLVFRLVMNGKPNSKLNKNEK